MNIDILGISEARWTSFGEQRLQSGGKSLYSGKPDGQPLEHGVAFILSRKAAGSLMDWKPVNARIMTARFKTNVRNITILQAYAPTDSAEIAVME
jgi:hypothetical protein